MAEFVAQIIIVLLIVFVFLMIKPHPSKTESVVSQTNKQESKWYGQVKNAAYNKCMMPIHQRDLQQYVVLADCKTNPHQDWMYDGKFHNLQDKKCLTPLIGSVDNRLLVSNCFIPVSYDKNPPTNKYITVYPHFHQTVKPDIKLNDYQKWIIDSKDQFQIRNSANNTCLDVTDSVYGLTVVQAQCEDKKSQLWSSEKI